MGLILAMVLSVLVSANQTENQLDIAPAYAEVDCNHGLYTGYRYRFLDDPIIHTAILYQGTVFIIKATSVLTTNRNCLYS